MIVLRQRRTACVNPPCCTSHTRMRDVLNLRLPYFGLIFLGFAVWTYSEMVQLCVTWRGACFPLNGRPAFWKDAQRPANEAAAPILSAARHRRAGSAARAAGQARAHD